MSVLVRKFCFLYGLRFSGGPDPRYARAGTIYTQFIISGVASKSALFLLQ